MKESNNIYVAVDFSIISPGICLIQNGKFKWISVYKTQEDDHKKLLKKTDGPFSILDSSETVSIHFLNKPERSGSTYSQTERIKLHSAIESTISLVQIIKSSIEELEPGEVYFAMEGVSFGASGNTLIDICMATGMFRQQIIEEILGGNTERFSVFSPGTIKKYALKGNAEKQEMYSALLEKEETKEAELVKLMRVFNSQWVTPGGSVKKPLDDLVDATWIALLLQDVITGKVFEEEKKVSKKGKKRKKV